MKAPRREPDAVAWMEAYGPGLRRYFRRRIADGDVDDLVQEVFLRLHSRYMNGSIENLEGYLFRTAHNVLVSRYREQASRIVSSSDKWAEGLSAYDPISPERITIGQEEYRRVIAAIQNLPPRTREAFELHRFENLTYQAIAQRMGISRNSVKDLMHRALLHITEAVEAGQ